jgi:hypothetical protein
MRRLLLIPIAALVFAAPAAAGGGTLVIAMHDPGCHWFQVGNKFLTSMTVTGPIRLYNIDEATLKVVGPKGAKLDRVGGKLALVRGVYHITMVGQAPDDNHLLLMVK